MENQADRYELLMEKLRQTPPVLHDAEGLTGRILQEIGNPSFQKESHLILWFRVVSSAAAVFLLGLLLFQQSEPQNMAPDDHQTQAMQTSFRPDTLARLASLNDSTSLMQAYLCYRQQNSIKNDQFRKQYENF